MPGNVRIQRTLLCQALFMDILKVRMKRNFFARQFLYGNIESVWDSVDATNTFFQCLGTVQYHEQRQRLVCALYTY